jgi:hypothetical protein
VTSALCILDGMLIRHTLQAFCRYLRLQARTSKQVQNNLSCRFLPPFSSRILTASLPFPFHPSVAVGAQHACAVDHTVGGAYCWGNNNFCQLGDNISACLFQSNARRRDDPARAQGQLGTKITSVTVGNRHTCAITINKDLYCWGDNRNGYLGNSNASLSVVAAPVLVSLNTVFNYSPEPPPPPLPPPFPPHPPSLSPLSPLMPAIVALNYLFLRSLHYLYRPRHLLLFPPLALLPAHRPRRCFAGDTVRDARLPHLQRQPQRHPPSLPFSPLIQV